MTVDEGVQSDRKLSSVSLASKYLFIVIFTALRSASKARRSDMISAVAPPSFCPRINFVSKNTRNKK